MVMVWVEHLHQLVGYSASGLCTSSPISDVSNSFSQLDTTISSVGSPVYAPDSKIDLISRRPVDVDRFLFVGESTQLILK